jgi:hypothetical protein
MIGLSMIKKMNLPQIRIEKLEHDLYEAVEIAYLRGASDWVCIHYPQYYERLRKQYDGCAA